MNPKKQEQSYINMSNHGIKSLSLTDIVDIEILQHLQDSFAQTFNMPSIIYGPKGSPITQPSCFTDFCTLVRSTKKGAERCETFDSKLILSLRENPEPTIRHGCALNNMVTGTVPIIIYGHHLANWGIGQMINRSLDLDEIREYANTIGVDQGKLVAAARTLIPVEEETFQRVVSFLQVLSEQVSMLGFKNLKQARELAKRKLAEKALQKAHDELEVKVQKRTKDLVQANESLHHEIQERKQTEGQLKINEEILNKAQEIAHVGSWHLDLENNNLTWSDEVYRIFGLQPQDFDATYETFMETVHPNDKELVNSTYKSSIENNMPYDIVHRIIRPNCEVRIVHEKSENILNESGEIICSFGMVHDITEAKENEEEMEKLILSLQKTLAEIKTLKGILPICSFCKKIRTDDGCWDKLEVYIMKHTDAGFSHGICPECYKKNYSQLEDN